ncbi:MAG: glycosyltransferase family 2 protein [Tepidisphaeraceae bacterium]
MTLVCETPARRVIFDDPPLVSVIIPVFNDPQRLRACLERLEAQTYPRWRYEVIVVDNGSTPPIHLNGMRQVRVLYEPRPGSYHARNTGIAAATGEVLAFTDSDCVPAPDWIERGVARLIDEPNCGMVAGRVDVFVKDDAGPTAVELHEQLTAFQQRRYIEDHHYGATANVFTFRDVIRRVGPFNVKLKSSGDNEWGNRVFAAGYRQLYADDVRVAHPARRSLGEIYRKVRRLAGGQKDWKGEGSFTWRAMFCDLRPPVGLIVRTLRDPRLPGLARKAKFIGVEVFIRYTRALERTRLHLGAAARR